MLAIRLPVDTTTVVSLTTPLAALGENLEYSLISTTLLYECSFYLAHSEADVFSKPDAWYSAQALFVADPGLWKIEMDGEIAGGHQVLS